VSGNNLQQNKTDSLVEIVTLANADTTVHDCCKGRQLGEWGKEFRASIVV